MINNYYLKTIIKL